MNHARQAHFGASLSIGTLFNVLVLVVVAAFLLATAASIRSQREAHRQAALQQALAAARVVSARVDDHIKDIDVLLRSVAVAVAPDLEAIEANDAKLREIQSGLPPYFSSMSVLAPDGRMLNSSTASPSERAKLNFADRKYFIDATTSRGLAIGEPIVSRTSGERIVIMARPIVAQDGRISAVASVSTLLRSFQDLLVPDRLPPGSLVTLVDEHGVVLARSGDAQQWDGDDLGDSENIERALREHAFAAEVPAPDGSRWLSGYATAQRRHWIARVDIPRATALAAAQKDVYETLLVAGGVLLLALALMRWLVRSIVAPVRAIAATSAQIAAGDQEARARPDGPREIAAVATRINAMIDAQRAAQNELSERHEALRAKERQLSIIHDNAYEVIFVVGVQPGDRFRFVSVNRRFVETTGLPEDRIVGKPVEEVIPSPSYVQVLERYKEAIRTRRPVSWEETSSYPAGLKVAEVTVAPVFDAGGACTQLIGTVHDLTERRKAQQALLDSEEFYRRTLDNMLEGCQIIGFDWRYRYVNDAAARQGRKSKDALLGRTMMEVYPGIEASQTYAALQRCMTERTTRHFENEFTFPDGTRGWFQLGVQPVPEGIFVLSVDFTERRRAEEELRSHARRLEALRDMYSAILEARSAAEIADVGLKHLRRFVPFRDAGIVRFDMEQGEACVMWSERPPELAVDPGTRFTLQQYGLQDLDALGAGRACVVADIAAWDSRPPLLDALLRSGLRSYVSLPLRIEGVLLGALHLSSTEPGFFTAQHVEMATPIADQLAIGIHQAILRESIVRHSAELESRVEERTRELSEANNELELARAAAEGANRAKSAFLAMMSHEIRTPMNAISGNLELLALSRLTEEQARMLEVASVSTRSLLNIVNDVLDLSKIEAGHLKIQPGPVAVAAIVAEVEQLFGDGAGKKGLSLRSRIADEVPKVVSCDAPRVKQILSNLISNAVKFTDSGGIEIRVGATKHEAGKVRLEFAISDTGIGIDADDQARLFQPFTQLETGAARQFGGTGLGLAVSRRLAELMGGALSLESARAKGTTVTLAIPVAVADAASLPATSSPSAAEIHDGTRRSERLLVCDDNAFNLEIAVRQLRALGYAADTAESGFDAMKKWEAGDYALILLDCQMPGMSGYQVSQRIREHEEKNPKRKRTVILAYTANVMREDRERCLAAGMDGVVTKPIDLKGLRRTLEVWLGMPARPRTPPAATGQERVEAAAPIADGESPVDWAFLEEISGGDEHLEREILLGLIRESEAEARRVVELIPAGDMAEVARLAHRLKGAARTAGAVEIGALCEKLEALARAGGREAAIALKGRLQEEFERLKTYVELRYR